MKFKKELKTTSFISESCELRGNLYSESGIRIDGKVSGTLNCESTIYVGERAKIKAEIFTESLVSGGRIEGNITAEETVRLNNPGSVKGNIHTRDLVIEKEVSFEGNCWLRDPSEDENPDPDLPKTPRKSIPNR